MATNYQKGYAFERKVRKVLEDRGYFVIRSAGSKGPADLVAWKRGEGGDIPSFFQCKLGEDGITAEEREKMREVFPFGGCYFAFKSGSLVMVKSLRKDGEVDEQAEILDEYF